MNWTNGMYQLGLWQPDTDLPLGFEKSRLLGLMA